MEKELEDFLKDIPNEGDQAKDILNENLITPEKEDEPEKKEEVSEQEPHKNRRHRRWENQLSEKEKDLIAREARLEALSETRNFTEEFGSDEVSQKLAELYGTDENGKRAAQITKTLLESVKFQAKEEALNEVRADQQRSIQEQKQYESFIDSQLEEIEDEYNVDVTSDAPAARKARREFLEVVQTLSPKDEEGTITGYADFSGAWEMYQLRRSQEKSSETSNRQKELADRSMTKSGQMDTSKTDADATRSWLRQHGIGV